MSLASKRGRFRLGGTGPARDSFEPPKYIQQLITSINDGAKSAQLGALAFVAIGLFLLATSFSATDEDLLMGKSIAISQLGGVAVPVALSFGFMPAIFVAVHLYTLIRFELLAGNIRHFIVELHARVPVEADRVRCRQLLANIEFIQALAVPGAIFVYRWTAWSIIAVFPVMVLILVQLGSLRLQSQVVNVVHHVAIIADLVLLLWFSPRLRCGLAMGRRPADPDWPRWRRAARRAATVSGIVFQWMRLAVVPAAVIAADLAWFRVPEATETTVGDGKSWRESWRLPLEPGAQRKVTDLNNLSWPNYLWLLAKISWAQPVDLWLCQDIGIGCRFLSVPGRTLVAKVWDNDNGAFVRLRSGKALDDEGKGSFQPLDLRERGLRFANLENTLMFMADLRGAKMQRANLDSVSLEGARLDKASLQEATLTKARLQGSHLDEASLQGARLEQAWLQGAKLDGARLQGASFLGASLHCATLRGSWLQGTALDNAQMQGANLLAASLHGAIFYKASLQGANLEGAQLQGADLRGSKLWNTRVDRLTDLSEADLRNASFEPVPSEARDALLRAVPIGKHNDCTEALTAQPNATRLGAYKPDAGPILVSSVTDMYWSQLPNTQLTDDPAHIAERLAIFLADHVASVSAQAAWRVAGRLPLSAQSCARPVDDPLSCALHIPLGCRLLAHVATKWVTLPDYTVKHIRDLTGTCPPSPTPAPAASTTQGSNPAPATTPR